MADGTIGAPVVSPAATHDGVLDERYEVDVVRAAFSEQPPTALFDRRPADDGLRYMQLGAAEAMVRLLHVQATTPLPFMWLLSERR
tara:strand:- start:391 stop:648 length:258 start_codon:yes stop_codon:yes gene_type:complete